MKRIILLLVVASAAFAAGNILRQLNVAPDDASSEIISAFAYGTPNYSRVAAAFKAAAPPVRAAMVEQVLTWTKAYVSSPQFAKDYSAWRDQQKPQAPSYERSVDQEMQEIRTKQAEDMEESRKQIAALPADIRKAGEEALQHAAQAMKDADTAANRKAQHTMLDAERNQAKQQYQQSLADFNAKYPKTPRDLVRTRIREFLEATANVDYAAKLVDSNGRKKFANTAYEAKPGDWKLAFRAGRETTEKARAFAAAWLAEKK